MVDELVDQDLVPDVQGVFHRRGRDVERLHHVGLDHQHDHQCEREQDEQFRPPGEAAPAPGPGRAAGAPAARARAGRARTGPACAGPARTSPARAGRTCAGLGAAGAARARGLIAGVAGLGRGVTARRRSHRPGAPWYLRLCVNCPVTVVARQFNACRACDRRLAHTPVVVHWSEPNAGLTERVRSADGTPTPAAASRPVPPPSAGASVPGVAGPPARARRRSRGSGPP